jgi:hypothetical protein
MKRVLYKYKRHFKVQGGKILCAGKEEHVSPDKEGVVTAVPDEFPLDIRVGEEINVIPSHLDNNPVIMVTGRIVYGLGGVTSLIKAEGLEFTIEAELCSLPDT